MSKSTKMSKAAEYEERRSNAYEASRSAETNVRGSAGLLRDLLEIQKSRLRGDEHIGALEGAIAAALVVFNRDAEIFALSSAAYEAIRDEKDAA
jgi:hypothetical protein